MSGPIRLCRVEDLAGVEARAFDVALPGVDHGVVVVPHMGTYRAYLNRCPHRGLPLNWLPDRFLDAAGRHLQCANHAALFTIADGHCVAGPCAGGRLTPVPVVRRGEELWLDGTIAAAD